MVFGVGVAGLRAIATAKRLGAVIEASDVRPSVKEQVESLGAKFIDVPYQTPEVQDTAEGVGGYARPMPPSWLKRLKAGREALESVIDFIAGNAKAHPNAVFAGSVPYLMLAGNVVSGWQMARAAGGGRSARQARGGRRVSAGQGGHGALLWRPPAVEGAGSARCHRGRR